MTFSKEWDKIYADNKQMNKWPFTDLVSYIIRYSPPYGNSFQVLELGCGSGPNIPFFKGLGVKYYAIEGSSTIVARLWEVFPELQENIVVGDFTKKIPFPHLFDLVVDRGSVTCNSTAAIKKSLRLIYEKLKPGGKFIGIDWFSTLHSDYKNGIANEDVYSRYGYINGPFANIGRVHFADKTHMQELFSDFIIEVLEHKTVTKEIPRNHYICATWNIVARKG